jgi:outer membrane protein TolC
METKFNEAHYYKSNLKLIIGLFTVFLAVFLIFIGFFQSSAFSAGNIKKQKAFHLLSLQFLIKKALKNPQIKSSIYKYLGYKENITIAGRLPEPAFGFGITADNGFNNPQIGTDSMSSWNFSISQTIPFPTKLFIKSDIKKSLYKLLKDKTISLKLFTILNVKDVYYDLSLIEEDIKTFKENFKLLHLLLEYANRAYASGRINSRGPIRLILESDQIKTDLISLHKQKNELIYILSKFTNIPTAYFINRKAKFRGKVKPYNQDFNDLIKIAGRFNPEIKEGRQRITSSKLSLNLANQGYYPNFSVFFGYGDRYSLQPMLSGGLSLTLPIYFNKKQIPEINKAKKYNIAAVYQYAWIKLKTIQNLKTALSNIRNDYKSYYINKKLTEPEAKLLFNSYTNSLMVGKVSTYPLIDSFTKLLLIRLRNYKYEASYFKDCAYLETIIGKIDF